MIPYSLNPMGIDTSVLTDLDILRQIRDANPTSQLPTLWLDSKDPYTQWEGVVWGVSNKVVGFRFTGLSIAAENNGDIYLDFRKLSKLESIDNQGFSNPAGLRIHVSVSGLAYFSSITWNYRNLQTIDVTNCPNMILLSMQGNFLTSVPSLTSKGLITNANLKYNKMPPTEIARLRALGFTDAQLLPQDI